MGRNPFKPVITRGGRNPFKTTKLGMDVSVTGPQTARTRRLNPFNPQIPARPDFFVGREPEVTEFEKFLFQTIAGSPMNMSITGNRGIGKTSLLVKFEELSKENNCLVIRLSNYEGNVSNIVDFTEFISTNLKQELLSRRPLEKNLEKAKEWMQSLQPQIEWKDIHFSVEKKHIIQELLRQRLLKIWSEIQKEYRACVILIDEAEALERIEGVLPFLREVFQRLAAEAKYMLVLAGKLNFPERMSESFSPLNRFFPASKLNNFNGVEIKTYVEKKTKTTGVRIDEAALNLIEHESEGHPYVLVSLCYGIFDSLRDEEELMSEDVVKRALPKVHSTLEKDFFVPMYHPLSPKAKSILKAIAVNAHDEAFSFSEAVKWTKLESNCLSPYIQELLRRGILNKPERARYEFFHGLFLEYVKDLARTD